MHLQESSTPFCGVLNELIEPWHICWNQGVVTQPKPRWTCCVVCHGVCVCFCLGISRVVQQRHFMKIWFKLLCCFREKPLALYVFSNNKAVVQAIKESTSSGGFLVNDTMVHAGGTLFLHYHMILRLLIGPCGTGITFPSCTVLHSTGKDYCICFHTEMETKLAKCEQLQIWLCCSGYPVSTVVCVLCFSGHSALWRCGQQRNGSVPRQVHLWCLQSQAQLPGEEPWPWVHEQVSCENCLLWKPSYLVVGF